MIIQATLTKEPFIRLALWRHFSRKPFYFYAAIATIFTAYVIIYGSWTLLLLLAWLPLLVYVIMGGIDAWRISRDPQNPVFLTTTYEFSSTGVKLKTAQGESSLKWRELKGWKIFTDCYVLLLNNGSVLAIPKVDIPIAKIDKFELLLNEQVG
ncbi:YcxB family protein [Anaerolineales bacterium HSG24]|nr:YcxB family protein [Anaerolineales bacterium HSG24]